MRWSNDGLAIPTNIFEAALCGNVIGVRCNCGRRAMAECYALWWRFERKGWALDFKSARQRFFCLECSRRQLRRVRPAWVGIVQHDAALPMVALTRPDEREWKRAVRRVRS